MDVSNTETEAPMREILINEIAELSRANGLNDNEDPTVAKSSRDNEAPRRMKDLKEIALP